MVDSSLIRLHPLLHIQIQKTKIEGVRRELEARKFLKWSPDEQSFHVARQAGQTRQEKTER